MTDQRLRLRLGVFVAGALVVLGALIILFGRAPTLFSTKAEYSILFGEAPGIAPGIPVRKSGVRVGEVTGLDLDDATGQVRVRVSVDRKYLPRSGEESVISRGLLNGDTSIDMVPKTDESGNPMPRGEPLPPGSDLVGVTPASARTLLSQASAVIPTAQESLGQIVQSAKRFEQTVPKIDRATEAFEALMRSGREFIPELRQTNTRVQDLLGAAPPAEPLDQAVSIRVMLKEVIDLLKSIRPVTDELRGLVQENGPELNRTLRSIRETADRTNDLLNPENRKNVAATVKGLQVAIDDFTKTVRLVALLVDQSDKTLKEFTARAAQSEQVLTNLEKITRPAADNSEQIVKGVAETVRNLNAASENANKTLADLREILVLAKRPDGSLQKVLSDPTLYNNLNDATINLARVLARAERVAQDLQVFSDKIARKPETIGIGGVVRPSTGLKEDPRAPLPASPLPPAPPSVPLPENAAPGLPPIPATAVPAYRPPTQPRTDLPSP